MKKILFAACTILLLFSSCGKHHFITDRTYRNQVHADFEARMTLAEGCADQLFAGLDTLPTAEREAMEFLYAYMPYSDLADYDQAFFLQQVRTAFAARETFSWGNEVPEDIFRHFVLVYRVNNENLDTARSYFFHQLKERIADMSMEEAALEVNHWCHEHVAYRAADARTSSPLATLRTSLGRCGEESTFTVTALRAVGIPARQCYTPRWAHCDDNHAWVEVWSQGEWKFLGACEPDPELNMGWFAVPSTRCMMVHTKAFGRYKGDEEVVIQNSLYSELNLLSHYAPTRRVTVTVRTPQEELVAGAHVKFKLYNYAEYYTLADVLTDANGQAQLTTGLGDLLIWACKGEQYNYVKLDVRQADHVDIYLSREPGTDYVEQLDIVPPVAGEAKVTPTKEQEELNNRRKCHEDSLREAYTATFPTEEKMWEMLQPRQKSDLLPEQQAALWKLIQKSEGNYAEILSYVANSDWHFESFDDTYDYLSTFSDKDMRDIPAEVLQAQRTHYNDFDQPNYPVEAYKKGILPARISNELVRPWRTELKEVMADIKEVKALKEWTIRHIAVDDTGNYYNCPISPMGVYRLRHSDAHSRDIFFVAACRSLDIPAYLDNATNTIYVWQNGVWEVVSFLTKEPAPANASITLTYSGREPERPIYYPHFTLQRFVEGDFVTFDFEEDPRMASFPATLSLEPGYYCLSTGNRHSEGEVLSRMEFFEVKADQQVTKAITLRPLTELSTSRSSVRIDKNLYIMEEATLADYAGDKGVLFLFLGDYKEPSKHLVKELCEQKTALARWGGMTYLEAPTTAKALSWGLPNTDCFVGNGQSSSPLEKKLLQALQLDLQGDYPFVLAVAPDGTVLFQSHGYKIGLAEHILKALAS